MGTFFEYTETHTYAQSESTASLHCIFQLCNLQMHLLLTVHLQLLAVLAKCATLGRRWPRKIYLCTVAMELVSV